jgi:hypothetical protein
LSRYRKTKNQYYQTEVFRTDCTKFTTYQADKFQREKCTRQRGNRERLEGNTGKKFNTMKKRSRSKTSASKIQAWNGAQYLKKGYSGTKKNAELESP